MAVTSSRKSVYINGLTCGQPLHSSKVTQGGVAGGSASGTDGDENLVSIDGNVLEYHIIGTSTIIGWQKVAKGLRVPTDATDNDGIEVTGGILAQDKLAFTIGTDPAFHISARFDVSTNDSHDLIMVGFRNDGAYQKPQAPAVGMALYTDGAWLGVYDTASAFTTIQAVTELNNGGITATNTTDVITAATPFEFRVNVSSAGVVTFQHDIAANANPATAPTLVAPTATAAFTFDDGDVVIPSIIILRGATTAGTLDLLKLDIGLDEA